MYPLQHKDKMAFLACMYNDCEIVSEYVTMDMRYEDIPSVSYYKVAMNLNIVLSYFYIYIVMIGAVPSCPPLLPSSF